MLALRNQPNLNSISVSDFNLVAKYATLDILKDQYKQGLKKDNLNVESAFAMFLKNKAETTQAQYTLYWKQFTEFVKVHPLDVRPEQVDRYIFHLRDSGLGNGTIHTKLAAVSGFYTFLVRWEYMDKNPVKNSLALPKRKAKKELTVPTLDDVETILDSYRYDLEATGRGSTAKVTGAKKMIAVITLMAGYGFRAGAFEKMVVDSDGSFFTITKGKEFRGKIRECHLNVLAGIDLNSILPPAIQYNLDKKCKELFEAGKIEAVYHPHSFRHYFAVSQYSENKDLYRLKVLLNHSNVGITENYLRSLEIVE